MPTNSDDSIDLLTEPIFTVDAGDERIGLSLSGLLARLSRAEQAELCNLMPHQQHVMHAFLVQLGALACRRDAGRAPRRDEQGWRAALLDLAGSPEAFQLLVKDLSKPAFLQPPVPEGTLKKWSDVETPDALDILITSKNHDVKAARIRNPSVEHWVFALISLQTQQGFLGAGNYGIARMNGGFGNRPGIGVAPSLSSAGRFLRDVGVLLGTRDALLSDERSYHDGGIGLVWLEPWDGLTALAVSSLDPHFIEVCRRVRFVRAGQVLKAQVRPSKVARIAAKELLGNMGDPWIPVEVARGAALTLGASGFEYAKLSELLFGDAWQRPAALAVRPEDGPAPLAIARAFVRGQGKTEGLHERIVPIPERARSLFASREGRSRLGALAQERIEAAKVLRLRVLKPALCGLLQGAPEEIRFDDKRADRLLDEVDGMVDADFFSRLFDDIDEGPEVQRARFSRWLVELGRQTFERGIEQLPIPLARRERAVAAGESIYFGAVRRHLPAGFATAEAGKETV